MRVLNADLPPDHNIVLASDFHFGNALQHRNGIRRLVQMVKETPNTYLAILGDIGESVTRSHKHFERYIHQGESLASQYRKAAEVFGPIHDRIILVLSGNHDRRTDEVLNPVLEIFCHDLGLCDKYGTEQAKLIVRVNKRIVYKIWAQHGRESIRSSASNPITRDANMSIQLQRQLQRPGHGDCLVMAQGHTHWRKVVPPCKTTSLFGNGERLHALDGKPCNPRAAWIDETQRWYCSTGSYLKKSAPEGINVPGEGRVFVSSYAEYFPPNALGSVILRARGGAVESIVEVAA